MTKQWFALLTLTTMVCLVVGCQIPRLKQLEQENNELRTAMKEKEELLAQSQAGTEKQAETISACRQKIVTQQKQIDDLEMIKFELNKQLELCQVQLKNQNQESERLSESVENYRKQIRKLNDQLETARQTVASLQNQLKGLTTDKTMPSGTTTQPADK